MHIKPVNSKNPTDPKNQHVFWKSVCFSNEHLVKNTVEEPQGIANMAGNSKAKMLHPV